ncbi:hypothetical protein EVAR_95888_1 [Eumeta japonica]|uniref:Uncharacterized protein n=1 Tax=Eumeta variegata TaxID=151549 RepID=A0A4C2AB85_EUMVA|nr:hypothetical protein EVAR_95888_1 [Eumeta japonica]
MPPVGAAYDWRLHRMSVSVPAKRTRPQYKCDVRSTYRYKWRASSQVESVRKVFKARTSTCDGVASSFFSTELVALNFILLILKRDSSRGRTDVCCTFGGFEEGSNLTSVRDRDQEHERDRFIPKECGAGKNTCSRYKKRNRRRSSTNMEYDNTFTHKYYEYPPQSSSKFVQPPAALVKKLSHASKKSEHARRLASKRRGCEIKIRS